MEKCNVTEANYESNPDPFLLGKSLCVSGEGIALVCCVGTNSRSGMAEEKLNTEEAETPLQQKLGGIANSLGKFGVYFALLALVAGLLNIVVSRLIYPEIGWFGTKDQSDRTTKQLIKALITAITVIVIAVPEGLPLAVTLCFAFSV